MNGCVSMGVNEFSMADAFRYYRDELGLHVYPVDGPWSKREGAGKKPSIAEWWKYDPQDCNIEAVFSENGGGRCTISVSRLVMRSWLSTLILRETKAKALKHSLQNAQG